MEIVDALTGSLAAASIQAVVRAVDDKTHGMIANVALIDQTCEAKARELLGRFPFKFTLTIDRTVDFLEAAADTE